MKQYAVQVMAKHSNGRYGKNKYTTWCLSETSKQRSCYFAAEILAGMTWREILTEQYGEGSASISTMHTPWGCKLDDLIGYEGVEQYFSFRAFLES